MVAAAASRIRRRDLPEWWEWLVESVDCDGRERTGRRLYVPSPSDIEQRKRDTHWLYECGFPHDFVASVMQFGMPSVDRVRQMVGRHGARETLRRCRPFLARSEYTSFAEDRE